MKQKIKVGIVSAPERPSDMIQSIMNTLATDCAMIDDQVTWKLSHVVDPLTGAAESASELLKQVYHLKVKHEWDFAISITDLPVFQCKHIVVASVNKKEHVAQMSIPALGWLPVKRRIKKSTLNLLKKLYDYQTSVLISRKDKKSVPKQPRHLKFPIRYKKHTNKSGQKYYDEQYIIASKPNGLMRLILGMTFLNHPLKIIATFKKIIAIAFTTGTFALIFPTVWKLGQIFSVYRLSLMMIVAIIGLVIWIIIAHQLWETRSSESNGRLRRLYNLTTTCTLFVDVLTYYAILFILFLMTSILLVPTEHFIETISYNGQVSYTQYMRVAWVVSSLTTIVSAMGAGLENEALVRKITYGYRQINRYENSK